MEQQTELRAAPIFSLVVPTIGRTTAVEALLQSLERSSDQDFDVTIVDQNEDGRLDEICHKFRDRLRLRHLKVAFRGAARARNFGARYATGRFLNFPDDDCELLEETLADAREALESGNLKILIGMAVDRAGRASSTRFKRGTTPVDLWSMWGRNIEFTIFMDRTVFLQVGGFDEEFGVGSTYGAEEGAELLVRVIPALPDRAVLYDHRVQFYHPSKIEAQSDESLKRSFDYARGTGALVAKWPLAAVWSYVIGVVVRSAVALAIYSGWRRRYYWRRLAGMWRGFFDYRCARRVVAGEGRHRRRAGSDIK